MQSKVYASDIIPNRSRRFAEATVYYPALLIQPDGEQLLLLFTPGDLAQAVERGKRNPEDFEALRANHRRWRGGLVRAVAAGALIGTFVGAIWLALVL